jgi:hypothetical protein
MFSTLFSSSHNAEQRARYGAHYTSKADILLIVEPVLMQPLRRQWASAPARSFKDTTRASCHLVVSPCPLYQRHSQRSGFCWQRRVAMCAA